jgi:hypothetical protein
MDSDLKIEETLEQYFKSRNAIVGKRDLDGLFHPSMLGGCTRKLLYHYLSELPEHNIDTRLRRCFDHGHAIHEMLQSSLVEAYKARGVRVEVEVSINNTELAQQYELAGSADAVIYLDSGPVIYEAKSISSDGWSSLSRTPLIKHRAQANIYAMCLGARSVVFEYFDKGKDASKYLHMDVDEALWQSSIEQIERVRSHAYSADAFEAIPAEGSSYECRSCQFLSVCRPTLHDTERPQRKSKAL